MIPHRSIHGLNEARLDGTDHRTVWLNSITCDKNLSAQGYEALVDMAKNILVMQGDIIAVSDMDSILHFSARFEYDELNEIIMYKWKYATSEKIIADDYSYITSRYSEMNPIDLILLRVPNFTSNGVEYMNRYSSEIHDAPIFAGINSVYIGGKRICNDAWPDFIDQYCDGIAKNLYDGVKFFEKYHGIRPSQYDDIIIVEDDGSPHDLHGEFFHVGDDDESIPISMECRPCRNGVFVEMTWNDPIDGHICKRFSTQAPMRVIDLRKTLDGIKMPSIYISIENRYFYI